MSIVEDIIDKFKISSGSKKIEQIKYKTNKKEEDEESKDVSENPRFKCGVDSMYSYIQLSVMGYTEFLKNYGYKRGKAKWDIFIPNGYNKIDEQLEDLVLPDETKKIFAIPGCDNIVSKHNVWKTMESKYGREKSSEIIPESFLMDNDDHIELLKTKNIDRFILKKKKQRKEGLKLTSDINIEEIRKNEYLIAQKYIENPFLINNRKLNLRIYMLVTLHNGDVEVYLNKYGTCIYTNKDYDNKTDDFEMNITSYNLNTGIYNKNPLTLEQLRTYMNDNNLDHNKLFSDIKNSVVYFITAFKDQLGNDKFNKNFCFQVFGLDFILDENLKPYLLECNKGPEMKPKITSLSEPKYDDVKDIMTEMISKLTDTDIIDDDKLKILKKYYSEIYKGYPKQISKEEILKKIEGFYDNEKDLSSYPVGYMSGNGLKVQKDTLNLIGLLKFEDKNNGFYKIL